MSRPANKSTGSPGDNDGRFGSIVLILLPCYLPGYKAGGPIRSIENLVSAIGAEFRFKVVTMDRDLGDTVAFPGVIRNQWVPAGNAEVMYLQPGSFGFLRLSALLCSVDSETVLYINSFFSRPFSILPVLMRWLNLCRPRCLVVAPRGEFSPGALNLKAFRKQVYIKISRWLGLHNGLIWQASTAFEAADICRSFPLARNIAIAPVIPASEVNDCKDLQSHVAIASDLAAAQVGQAAMKRRPKIQGELRTVFVARVSRMKNLVGALRMLADLSGQVCFDIYGPKEDGRYWEECLGVIAALPANILVKYCGQIEHTKIGEVFGNHDLFFFPTLGENYGHVICESMMSGCPVLVSDQTPWRGLEALGVGWDLPLSETEGFRKALQQCVDMSPEEHTAMCARTAAFGASRANNPIVIEENRALFQTALAWSNSN